MYSCHHRSAITPAWLLRLFCAMLAVTVMVHGEQNTLKFDNITMQEGLSDNYVLCSIQDRYGFLWFGTRDGLNRYDGNSFKVYRHDADNPHSVSDASVNVIFEDRDGTLWMGTDDGGLNRFDRTTERFVAFRNDPNDPFTIPKGMIVSICEDNAGSLWIAVSGPMEGLCRFDRKRGKFIRYRHDPGNRRSISSDLVTSICRDSSGGIWIATEGRGLNRHDPSRDDFINAGTNPHYSFENIGPVAALAADDKGLLWIRSLHGVRSLNIRSGELADIMATVPQFRNLDRQVINTTLVDHAGLLWIGTSFGGLRVLDRSSGDVSSALYSRFDRQSIGSNRVQCITEDRAGNIWLGTDNGIARFNRRSWNLRYFQNNPFDPNSLPQGVVRTIFRDRSGRLWGGMEGAGLYLLDEKNIRVEGYRTSATGPGNPSRGNINVVYQGASGRLWAGGSEGLDYYDERRGSFTPYRNLPADITMGHVWDILEDREGMLWVATRYGLYRIDPATGALLHYVQQQGNPLSILDIKTFSLHEDRNGNIWVGTDGGLNRLDKKTGRVTGYTHDPDDPGSLSNNRVWYIHEDAGGYLWLGTSGGGVNRLDPATGRSTRFTEREGLASNTVCGILEDGHGRLWISTNNGISRFDPQSGIFRNYSAQDGFHINQFHFKSCFRDVTGRLYFGGTGGILTFHPDSIANNPDPRRPVLISFRVRDREFPLDSSITVKREIHLDHTSNFFTIEFAALDFTDPSSNLYQYRLDDFDTEWRTTDGRRPYAEYTNVPPGRYVFHLKKAGEGNSAGDEEIAVAIIIEPAYWQTWWFRAVIACSGTALLSLLVLLRWKNRERKAELQRSLAEYQLQALRAQMNPHFIFNALNSILHFILRHDPDAAHRYLAKFAKLIRFTLDHSRSEMVLLAEDLESLRLYIDLERLRLENGFDYEISVAPDLDPHDIDIPPMLIQPYVENAIKHGLAYRESPGKLLLDIRRTGPYILCAIIDDGIGRKRSGELKNDESRRHRSQGIALTEKRLQTLEATYGGRFRVDVTDLTDERGNAAGTRVHIYIPAGDL